MNTPLHQNTNVIIITRICPVARQRLASRMYTNRHQQVLVSTSPQASPNSESFEHTSPVVDARKMAVTKEEKGECGI